MPLRGQTIDVPFLPVDAQGTVTGAPVGELRSITNGITTRFSAPGPRGVRIEKRAGFAPLTSTTKEPAGGTTATSMVNINLLTSLADSQLVVEADDAPFVLGESQNAWQRFPYEMPTLTIGQDVVWTDNGQAAAVDTATALNGVRCYVWATLNLDGSAGNNCMFTIQNADGTPIRSNTTLFGVTTIKVVTDGTYFWFFYRFTASTSGSVVVYDTNGAQIATKVITFSDNVTQFDISYDSTFGVTLARLAGTVLNLTAYTIAGATITASSRNINDAFFNRSPAILENSTPDGFIYVSVVNNDVSFGDGVYVYKIATSGTASSQSWHAFNQFDYSAYTGGTTKTMVNNAGRVTNGNVILFSSMLGIQSFSIQDPLQNLTLVTTLASGGAVTVVNKLYGLTVASRTFLHDAVPAVVMYYQSVKTRLILTRATVGQPTHFIVSLDTQQAIGRFDYGVAAMDWLAFLGPAPVGPYSPDLANPNLYHLTSPATYSDGIRLALCYRSLNVTEVTSLGSSAGDIVSRIDVIGQASTVGVKDTLVSISHGKAIDYAGTLYLPGAIATTFNGQSFAEDSFNLAPEAPTVAGNAVGGVGLSLNLYSWVVVYEGVNPNGDRWLSQQSSATTFSTVAGGFSSVTITGRSLVLTKHTNVKVSIYRTTVIAGVMSVSHYKVTNDLNPLLNDPTSPAWTFVDSMVDSTAAANPQLPYDTGQLEHDPAPAFSVGTVADDRVFLAGYDNATWFSSQRDAGEALWFNADAWRIPQPSDDPIRGYAALDNRLVIFCARSIWAVPLGGFPDASGQNGNIPTPVRLPFANGCTGFVKVVRAGAVYSSSSVGIWLITRDLNNVQLGSNVVDDTDGVAIRGIAVDAAQRMHVALGSVHVVYDVISGIWTRNTSTYSAKLGLTFRGIYCFASDSVPRVFVQSRPASGHDLASDGVTTIPVLTDIVTQPVHFGGVKNFKRVWDCIMYGQLIGDHDMAVTVRFDDNIDGLSQTTYTYNFTPSLSAPYIYQLPPKVEECSSMSFEFVDSFPRGLTGGYALEMLSFEVAVEPGLNRINISARIKNS